MPPKDEPSEIRDYMQQSIRFAPQHLKWLTEETARAGISINAVVRKLVDNARTSFGLSPTMLEAIDKDRAAMGLDFEEYIRELLTQRYRDILNREFQEKAQRSRK